MKLTLSGVVLVLAMAMTGCATIQDPLPDTYTGPTAIVADSIYQESSSKGRYFALVAVNGESVKSAAYATRVASSGRGFGLLMQSYARDVPAQTMRVKLVASHVTAAPIHELASRAAGTFWDVEGEVSFTPVAGVTYTVRGLLDPKKSEVWIEDDKTKQKVAHVHQAQ